MSVLTHISNKKITAVVLAVAFSCAATSASAQEMLRRYNTTYKPSFAANATGLFTRDLTSNSNNQLLQRNGLGLDATMRQRLYHGTDLELNYGYSRFGTTYVFTQPNGTAASVVLKPSTHEATSAVIFHPTFFGISPFVGVGGGAIDFREYQDQFKQQGPNQWRGTGLAEVGIDFPVRRNVGLRLQGRSLIYRAPNFNTPLLATRNWEATVEPTAGVWFKF